MGWILHPSRASDSQGFGSALKKGEGRVFRGERSEPALRLDQWQTSSSVHGDDTPSPVGLSVQRPRLHPDRYGHGLAISLKQL